MNVLIICSSQRTGSTLIAELLKQTGAAVGCLEYFEPAVVMPREVLPAVGLKSVSEVAEDLDHYVELIRERWRPSAGQFLTLKLHHHHLAYWSQHGLDLEKYFPNAHYMLCTRGNTLLQAISAVKANQTESWSHGQKPKRAPVYDFQGLTKQLNILVDEQFAWERYFTERNIIPFRLAYEALDEDHRAVLHKVNAWLGLGLSKWRILRLAPRLKRQRSRVNYEWEMRYYQDLGQLEKKARRKA